MTDNNSEQTKNNIEKKKLDSSNNNIGDFTISEKRLVYKIDEPDIDPSQANPSDIYLYGNYVKKIQSRGDDFLKNLNIISALCFLIYFIVDSLFFPDELGKLCHEYVNYIKVIYCNIWKGDFPTIYQFSPLRAFTLTILMPLIPGGVFYYLSYIRSIQRAEEKLRLIKEGYKNSLLEDPNRRCIYFLRQLRELTAYSAGMFSNEESKKKEVLELRKQIGDILETEREREGKKYAEKEGNSGDMNEVEYLLSSLRELIESERIEQKNQKKLRIFNVILIFFYIAVLVVVMVYTGTSNIQLKDVKIPFLDVPLWAIIWGATGSLSAVLYRFYTTQKIQVSQETQWLIARPLIGILMSAVAYLAVRAGLIVLDASPTPPNTDLTENARRVTSIVCFLAGFSELVYIGLIELLTDRTLGKPPSHTDDSKKQKNEQKTPDSESDQTQNNTQTIDDSK